jgi:hypothetical protein
MTYTRRTKAHDRSSRPRQAWARFIKELKEMLSRKRPTFEVIPYTSPIGKEQIRILGDDDTNEGNTRYSNFSFEEGLVWVSEEKSYPEEDPLIYYDPEEDMFAYEPSDVVNIVDGPKYDSYTSGTFIATVVVDYQISMTKFL